MRDLRYKKTLILVSFIDYQKLRFFFHKYGETDSIKALQNILEDVQEDIEIKRKETQKQIEEAEKAMKEVYRNGKDYSAQ